MREVYSNLFVGSQLDYENLHNKQDWQIIQACRIPYHAQALGYNPNQGAPKDSKERLYAIRDNRLILNIFDIQEYNNIDIKYKEDINKIFDEAINYIHKYIANVKVLVHCNQGMSRSPSIALMYLKKHTEEFRCLTLKEAILKFTKIYPLYTPSQGILEYIISKW